MERSRPSPVRTAFGFFVLILGLTALNTRACAPYVAAQGAAPDGAGPGALEDAAAGNRGRVQRKAGRDRSASEYATMERVFAHLIDDIGPRLVAGTMR